MIGTGADWRVGARRELLRLRGTGRAAAWGYRKGGAPAVEPTSLAALALIATRDVAGSDPDPDPGLDPEAAVAGAAAWVASLQRPDGSIGLSADRPTPGWGTPLALLLWRASATSPGAFGAQRRRATQWLLGQKGSRMPRSEDPARVVGHDTMLVGWPWVGGTHSWLEPTALAVLALRGEGAGSHARVAEGLRLIRDRAIAAGGWNYGNKAAFGRALRPQPATTGLALLALPRTDGRDDAVSRAIDYLHETLPGVRASVSLGWGLLGLRAWGESPAGAGAWLAEAHARASGRPDAATKLALLLLAGGDHALEIFE
jgi:hypothetical protein